MSAEGNIYEGTLKEYPDWLHHLNKKAQTCAWGQCDLGVHDQQCSQSLYAFELRHTDYRTQDDES
ncbi:unnamed protein product [Prunus armeniaca]|uniref:Uncharacterized protein n=1 Tax=Prunus armeniaca TaxID=36596 RepID=A0A6J5VP33_PRUAR|nr:unnamed protein product [Prunus armeniaca]